PQSLPTPPVRSSVSPARAISNPQSNETLPSPALSEFPAQSPLAIPSHNAIPPASLSARHPSPACTATPNASHQLPAPSTRASAHPPPASPLKKIPPAGFQASPP